MKKLHLELNKNHCTFQWAKTQADRVGAIGHIGTHLDCYTKIPQKDEYRLKTQFIDCTENMPNLEQYKSLPNLWNKALLLYTGNLKKNSYGSVKYMKTETQISEIILKKILTLKPKFILIDSHGIGKPGNEHIKFDKMCESEDCHVIENVNLSPFSEEKINEIKITIDLDNKSTGKPCKLYGYFF